MIMLFVDKENSAADFISSPERALDSRAVSLLTHIDAVLSYKWNPGESGVRPKLCYGQKIEPVFQR